MFFLSYNNETTTSKSISTTKDKSVSKKSKKYFQNKINEVNEITNNEKIFLELHKII